MHLNYVKNTKHILLVLSVNLWFSFLSNAQEIDISSGWKFSKGDNMAWAKPEYNDATWQSIELNRFWESQGFPAYDGYGWYRLSFDLPDTFRKNAASNDSLRFYLGKIDDHDQVYLNGVLIGQNAGMSFLFGNKDQNPNSTAYNKNRIYTIATSSPFINWNGKNTLAIRVFDQLGGGGMGSADKYTIQMADRLEKVKLISTLYPFKYDNNEFSKKLVISVTSANLAFPIQCLVFVKDVFTEQVLAKFEINTQVSSKQPTFVTYNCPTYQNAYSTYTILDPVTGNAFSVTDEVPYILTPAEPLTPRFNGAAVYGVYPNHDVIYALPVSGKRPMKFSAHNLPQGLQLHPSKGIITGKAPAIGAYPIHFTAENAFGSISFTWTLKSGDLLALTPPMGWNSWNCWGLSVSDEKVRTSANALIEKGLIHYGWAYMNIDDGWEGKRDKNGVLQPNDKFPDMKGLADFMHSEGLKLGIYSSPGPKTCGGYEGSYGYEKIDAKTWADWGIDYLKFDMCSYTEIIKSKNKKFNEKEFWNDPSKTNDFINEIKKPYEVMRDALRTVDRDIVYSLCQYGWAEVWKWGADMNGNLWRTTGDIEDTWSSLYSIGFSQFNNAAFVKPGRWNDPDMLIVGKVGWGPALHPTRLTVNQQYTHITLWSLLAAPLLIGCDMAQLDDFTLNLLKNNEVIAVNQDILGKQAERVIANPDYQVWVKPLEGGSYAVGIFNISSKPLTINISWKDVLPQKSITRLRNLWTQTDLDQVSLTQVFQLPSHGSQLIKVF